MCIRDRLQAVASHPAMAEVKYVHQNVGFEAVDAAAGIFKITNRFYFTNLKKYQIHYNVCLLYTSRCV